MENNNIVKAQNLSRKIESTVLVLQDSTQNGNIPIEIYADILEILADMTSELKCALSADPCLA